MINKKLDVFSTGRLQDVVTILQVLLRSGLKLESVEHEIRNTINGRHREMKARASRHNAAETKIKKSITDALGLCPLCGGNLLIRQITEPQGAGNINGYRAHIYCKHCVYEKYSTLPPLDYLNSGATGAG